MVRRVVWGTAHGGIERQRFCNNSFGASEDFFFFTMKIDDYGIGRGRIGDDKHTHWCQQHNKARGRIGRVRHSSNRTAARSRYS